MYIVQYIPQYHFPLTFFLIEMNNYRTKNGLNNFVHFSDEMALKTKILDKKEQDKIDVICTFPKFFRTR